MNTTIAITGILYEIVQQGSALPLCGQDHAGLFCFNGGKATALKTAEVTGFTGRPAARFGERCTK